MMKKNLSHTEGYVRLCLGLILLAKGIVNDSGVLITFGALQTASGATRFCPLYKLLHISTGGCSHGMPKSFQ